MIDIGAAIGAAIDQMTQLTTTGLNMWNTWRTNEQAYDQSVKLWQKNNEYNKPINQMKRLEEAGLNPYLVYGNGVTGNTSSQPSSPAVQGSKFNLDAASSILFGKQLQKMNAEMKGLETRNKMLDYQLANIRWNSNLFRDAGLPTNSSWWAPGLFSIFKNPKNVNRLKGLGLEIGDVIASFFNPPKVDVKKEDAANDIHFDWLENGKVSREPLD